MNQTKKSTKESHNSIKDRVGGLIEKAGEKIADAGATKLGQKIHDLGDRLEDSHKNPSHPEKV